MSTHTTWDDYSAARTEHRNEATSILNGAIGWADGATVPLDPATATDAELRRWVAHYLPLMRAWDQDRPEFVRDLS